MKQENVQVGRLAMREEGKNWNAYYAETDSMKNAILLGSIQMKLVETKERRDTFINLMRDCVADLIEIKTGVRPSWGGEQLAPEHERAGHG